MDLWQEMIMHMLSTGDIRITPSKEIGKLLESQCYQALEQIRDVIRDDSVTDAECFFKIEKIVSILEEQGSNGGIRHDFG